MSRSRMVFRQLKPLFLKISSEYPNVQSILLKKCKSNNVFPHGRESLKLADAPSGYKQSSNTLNPQKITN